MEDFVIANYVLALQDAYKNSPKSREGILTALYHLIAKPANLVIDGKYIDCSKTVAHQIVKREREAHRQIREHSGDPIVRQTIVDAMDSSIVVNLHFDKELPLIERLKNMIKGSNLVDEQKERLLDLADNSTTAEFLSEAYLLALVQPNKKTPDSIVPIKVNSEHGSFSIHKELPEIPIPEESTSFENRYVRALFDTYAEAQGINQSDISVLDNNDKHKAHFDKQRRLFYAAEALRRGVRDVYADDGISHFEKLEKDIYEGIDEVYEKPYKLGFDRLTEVLIQAAKLPLHGNFLARETYWVDSGVQKGICHFLVNDEKIDGWVK